MVSADEAVPTQKKTDRENDCYSAQADLLTELGGCGSKTVGLR